MLIVNNMLPPFSPENTELMQAVQNSRYGRDLAQEIRYDRYCFLMGNVKHTDLPQPQKSDVKDEWVGRLLDVDADNLQHMPFTAVIGQWACWQDGLSTTDTNRVVRGLLVHDLMEAKTSDVTYDKDHARGHGGFKEDHKSLAEILRSGDFPMLSYEDIDEIQEDMDDSKHEVQSEPKTDIGLHIEIGERLGYLHAGIRANQAAHSINRFQRRISRQYDGLLWMAENTFSNSLPRLVELAPRQNSVMQFLRMRHDQISDALGQTVEQGYRIWPLYRADGLDKFQTKERIHKFGNALDAWSGNGGRIVGLNGIEPGIFS